MTFSAHHGRCRICDDPITQVDREAMEARNIADCADRRIPYHPEAFEEQEPICIRCQESEDGDAYDRKQERDAQDGANGPAELFAQQNAARRLK